jgi:hypothetical protein
VIWNRSRAAENRLFLTINRPWIFLDFLDFSSGINIFNGLRRGFAWKKFQPPPFAHNPSLRAPAWRRPRRLSRRMAAYRSFFEKRDATTGFRKREEDVGIGMMFGFRNAK